MEVEYKPCAEELLKKKFGVSDITSLLLYTKLNLEKVLEELNAPECVEEELVAEVTENLMLCPICGLWEKIEKMHESLFDETVGVCEDCHDSEREIKEMKKEWR